MKFAASASFTESAWVFPTKTGTPDALQGVFTFLLTCRAVAVAWHLDHRLQSVDVWRGLGKSGWSSCKFQCLDPRGCGADRLKRTETRRERC